MRCARFILGLFALLLSSMVTAHTRFDKIAIVTDRGITLSIKGGTSLAEKEFLFADIYDQFNQQFLDDTFKVFLSLGDWDVTNSFNTNNRYLTCGFNYIPQIKDSSETRDKSIFCVYSSKDNFDISSILKLIIWAANNPKEVLSLQTKHTQYSWSTAELSLTLVPENEIEKVVKRMNGAVVDRFLSQKFTHNKIQRDVTCSSLAYSFQNGTFHIQDQLIGHHPISRTFEKQILSVDNLQDIRCDEDHNCIIAAEHQYYFYSPHRKKHMDTISDFLLPGIQIAGFGNSCLSLKIAYLKTAFAEIYYNKDSKLFLIRQDNGDTQYSIFAKKRKEPHELLLPLLELTLSVFIASYILYNLNAV